MALIKSDIETDRRSGLATGVVALLGAAAVLGACSSVPDAVNPVEWYRGTVDYFSDEEGDLPPATEGEAKNDLVAERGQPAPGADQPFPQLSSVPEPPPTTTTAERQRIAEGLAADREQARYATEEVQLQSDEATNPLQRSEPEPMPEPEPALSAASAPTPPPTMTSTASATPPPPPPSTAPAAPRVVATVPTSPPPQPTSVEETFRARLAQRLPTTTGQVPQSLNSGASGGGFQTVVISSGGIESGDGNALPTPRVTRLAATGSPANAGNVQTDAVPISALPTSGTVRVATILFPNGSASLDAGDRRILRDVTRLYRERGGKLQVVGHASSRTRNMDPVSHKMANLQISAARADAVAAELAKQGVSQDDIIVDAGADRFPVYYEVMPSGEAGNRRAEVYLVY